MCLVFHTKRTSHLIRRGFFEIVKQGIFYKSNSHFFFFFERNLSNLWSFLVKNLIKLFVVDEFCRPWAPDFPLYVQPCRDNRVIFLFPLFLSSLLFMCHSHLLHLEGRCVSGLSWTLSRPRLSLDPHVCLITLAAATTSTTTSTSSTTAILKANPWLLINPL